MSAGLSPCFGQPVCFSGGWAERDEGRGMAVPLTTPTYELSPLIPALHPGLHSTGSRVEKSHCAPPPLWHYLQVPRRGATICINYPQEKSPLETLEPTTHHYVCLQAPPCSLSSLLPSKDYLPRDSCQLGLSSRWRLQTGVSKTC